MRTVSSWRYLLPLMAMLLVVCGKGDPTPALEPPQSSTPLPTTSVKSTRPPVLDYVYRPPPIASLIAVGTPSPNGETMVTGAAGSVPGSVYVTVTTLEYGMGVLLASEPDGSFKASVISAPGATLQVRYNPYVRLGNLAYTNSTSAPPTDADVRPAEPDTVALSGFDPYSAIDPQQSLQLRYQWPGTLIRVDDAQTSLGGTPFSAAGKTETPGGIILWAIGGGVDERTLNPGDDVPVSGTMRVYIPPGLTEPTSLNIDIGFALDPLFDADGRQTTGNSEFLSRLLTPTGLPIELIRGAGLARIQEIPLELVRQGLVFVSPFDTTLTLHQALPPGIYRLFVRITRLDPVGGLGNAPPQRGLDLDLEGATLGVLTVGSPQDPRLSPMLLADTASQGSRGVIAEQERGLYDLADRIAIQSDVFVVQPRIPGNGQPVSYRLEPFFPFLSVGFRNLAQAPMVPLALPGGSLTVSVQTPSGKTDDLGTAPILQARTGERPLSDGRRTTDGGRNPGDILKLTTLSDAFAYSFAEYGRYTISLSGSVADIWGQKYPFSGSFQVWAAETLDIETASLPSTPFRVGDRLPAVVNVYPGVPATVEMSVEVHPIDESPKLTESVTGTANRFGYFDGAGKAFELAQVGEYLVKVRASYTDAEGRLWMGTRRWGSGIASPSPKLIAHGRRGHDQQPQSERRAWFNRVSTGIGPGSSNITFPYLSGDVVWSTDNDSVAQEITVQDTSGEIADLLQSRLGESDLHPFVLESFQGRRATGDLPLLVSTDDGLEPAFAPDAIDQWGYAYMAVERPGVRVREMVGTSGLAPAYWRFDDSYLAQRGMGWQGDLPNDIKWQFGAAVFKRPSLGIGEVAVYGSLWVEIPDDDPVGSRVFPPFQSAAGGPSGGPIMTLKGQEIDIFLMPTAVRPGAVLEIGDRFVFAGQVGPPLASRVTARVTSPSGRIRTIKGQANPVGYFFNTAADFVVDEPGVWTVNVEVLHDSITSAGRVEPPYPTGGVLGSAHGQFRFYTVPKTAERVDFGLPHLGFASNAGKEPIRFYPHIPEGWTDVDAAYTISMPGFILEEATVRLREETLQVIYDPVRLNQDFPNLELTQRPMGLGPPGLSDEVFVSVLLSGLDPSGNRAYAAKLLTLVGEDIYDLN